MRHVVLSAGGDRVVYAVPDAVAERLEDCCMEFCAVWLPTSPHAAAFRRADGVLCYTEADFIDYLNTWRFPQEPSRLVEDLGPFPPEAPLPEPYRGCPAFDF